ncbi:hypothetical protein QCA50_012539 [Cerrena zonata]|uniref:Uncharacterized protein n=1 Tax=Cerrena zonata TaxID=2478898 RepID=A0AAW0FZD5_9APHY
METPSTPVPRWDRLRNAWRSCIGSSRSLSTTEHALLHSVHVLRQDSRIDVEDIRNTRNIAVTSRNVANPSGDGVSRMPEPSTDGHGNDVELGTSNRSAVTKRHDALCIAETELTAVRSLTLVIRHACQAPR